MSSTAVIFLIVLVLALMVGSFWLGRYFALTYEVGHTESDDNDRDETPDQRDRLPGPASREFRPRGAPPPVLAGPTSDGGAFTPSPAASSNPRRGSPPPAASAGAQDSGMPSSGSGAPKRSARPPAAAAAWDGDKKTS